MSEHSHNPRPPATGHAAGPPRGHEHHHDHGDEHDHGHSHGGHSHAPAVGRHNERIVLFAFVLTFGFMIAEVVGGLLSGSLALIADAGHMLTDAAALALAWAGFRFGRRAADSRRTFGYMRLEVLAGFVNAIALIALVIWIGYEAFQRLLSPEPVLAGPMFVVAVAGLAVNVGVFLILMRGDREHVNIRGAMLHVVGDLLGSVAAVGAAIAIYFTGWTPVDPILSVLLSVLILRSAWALLKNSLHILMEGAPAGIEVETVRARLIAGVAGLADVSHVHLWSITSGRTMATLEITLTPGAGPAEAVAAVRRALAEDFGIEHCTVEVNWGARRSDCALADSA